jgi:hypothetical protein
MSMIIQRDLPPTWHPDEEFEWKGYLDAMLEIKGGPEARAMYIAQRERGEEPKRVLDRCYLWLLRNEGKKRFE